MPTGPLSLRLILVVAGAVTTLGIMLLITWSVEQLSSRSLTEQIGRAMEVLADQVQDKIDRTMVERARDLKSVAELIKGDPVLDSNAANAVAKKQLLSNPAIEWLGILNRDMGVVGAAGDPNLASYAIHSPWVKDLVSGTADTAPRYRLLPSLSSNSANNAAWHIEMAVPILDRQGLTTQIAVAIVSGEWARATKSIPPHGEQAFEDVELFVIADNGQVLLGPHDHTVSETKTAAFLAAQKKSHGWVVETDPQGTEYVTGFSNAKPDRSFGDLDLLVLMRQKATLAFAPLRDLERSIFVCFLIFAFHAILIHWYLASTIASPLLALAGAADRLRHNSGSQIPRLAQFAEVKTLSESLIALVGDLKDQNRLLATASHDLRQPLHALTLYNYILKRRLSQPADLKLMGQVEQSLTSLKTMLDALLHIARLDSGAVPQTLVPVRLRDVIQRIGVEYSFEADRTGLRFNFFCVDTYVLTDAALFETIVRNLVSNAFKFTSSGGVVLAARSRGKNVLVEVYDTGPGVEPERQIAIFNEFERSRVQANGPNEGLGLGLSIVRRHAKLIGADVEVRSVVGRGSRFSITLEKIEPSASQHDRPALRRQNPSLARARIMVLDDNPVVLDALRQDLSERGALVTTFTSAKLATYAIKSGLAIDVAVLDYDLADDISGVEFYRRRQRDGNTFAALILTGRTDTSTLAEIRDCGIALATKPANPDDLAAQIAQLLTARADRKQFLSAAI